MRIIYVAKHDSGGNDDEGAITFALEQLGHEVVRVPERNSRWIRKLRGDFLLCHHWHDNGDLVMAEMPKVFWCFDLIDWPNDPTIARRCAERRAWATDMTARCDLGFMTDGDWVAKDTTGKLHWLMQGADERVCGPGESKPRCDILFTGIGKNGGQGRASFVDEMTRTYGYRFLHVSKGVHGRAMADLIAGAKIVVAPDYPVTDRYWSNRVYNVLGFGGFLVHPWSVGLAKKLPIAFQPYYENRDELHRYIRFYLDNERAREDMQSKGYEFVLRYHTYRHRCIELVRIVKERLGI